MFVRSFASKDRAGKAIKTPKRSFGKDAKARLIERMDSQLNEKPLPHLTSAIITLVVGKDQRLFAAHEDVLNRSSYFRQACKELFFASDNARRIVLSDEAPESLSCVLEFLYKGDYYPRLMHDKRRDVWYLEGAEDAAHFTSHAKINGAGSPSTAGGARGGAVMLHPRIGDYILRDTAVYCAGERYGLEDLKRLALRKQGLQSGIEVGTILRSMRYAYAHTPDTDSRLRAHYLALIVRSRRTFKRSGTMQQEMTLGGSMFFDLFVAMCNHLDDVSCNTPKTV